MIKISTSILSSNNRIDTITKLNDTKADYIHIDVMDGLFVPNTQLPVNEVNELANYSEKLFDIHLMIEDPETYIKKLKIKNIKMITIHVEINKDINKIIDLIKSYNYDVGLAIKPNTDINILNDYIDKVDTILIMSVEPGFGGQKFIENTVNRIKEIKNKKSDILIEVDGGINQETINKIKYTCDIAVVGSYIVNSANYNKTINDLKK